jgi:hypothetical protein
MKVHDRILELSLTMNAAGDTVAVTAVKYYRDRGKLAAGEAQAMVIDTTAAQTSPAEVAFGELVPPPTHLRMVFAAF